jgi:hypothetical protein
MVPPMGTIIASLALLLSLAVAARQFYLEHRITITVHEDTIYLQGSDGREPVYRIVVHNSGPGTARDVQIQLINDRRQPMNMLSVASVSRIPLLPGGVDFSIRFHATAAENPAWVEVSWRGLRRPVTMPVSTRVIV